jgi:hypothetical protein
MARRLVAVVRLGERAEGLTRGEQIQACRFARADHRRPEIDLRSLYDGNLNDGNLISGVVTGLD